MGRPMRMTPLLSSVLWAWRGWARVETSALGELEPSTVRNTAERPRPSSNLPPSVASNTVLSWWGGMVQPTVGTWQLTQRRPLEPRSWKNSLLRSMEPWALTVVNTPVASATGTLLASWLLLSQWRVTTASRSADSTELSMSPPSVALPASTAQPLARRVTRVARFRVFMPGRCARGGPDAYTGKLSI